MGFLFLKIYKFGGLGVKGRDACVCLGGVCAFVCVCLGWCRLFGSEATVFPGLGGVRSPVDVIAHIDLQRWQEM